MMKVRVHPVNDAPVIHLIGEVVDPQLTTDDMLEMKPISVNTIYGLEDEDIVMGPVVIRDVDLSSKDSMHVTIKATYGTFSVADHDRLLVDSLSAINGSVGVAYEQGSGSHDRLLEFVTPIEIANQMMHQIIFHPASDYYGSGARLEFIVNDMNGRGYSNGGPKTVKAVQYFVIEPINDPPLIELPDDFKNSMIFVVKDNQYIRIEGAKYRAVNSQFVNSSRYWQAGYELWRLREPLRPYDKTQLNMREYWGAGDLEWSQRQLADISSGVRDSHPHYFANFKGSMYFVADDGEHGFEMYRNDGSLEDLSIRQMDSKARLAEAENERPSSTPGTNGFEDETAVAPHPALVRDLMPGSQGSHPKWLTVYGDYLYFSANGIDVSWRILPDAVDECGSFKQSDYDPRVYYVVSADNVWDIDKIYDCPTGYHWASTEEAHTLFSTAPDKADERRDHMWYAEPSQLAESGERHGKQTIWYTQDHLTPDHPHAAGARGTATSVGYLKEQKTYYDRCGWEGYLWEGISRKHFRFSDSKFTGEYKDAGWPDSLRPGVDAKWSLQRDKYGNRQHTTSEFAGIVCVAGPSVTPCTTGNCRQAAGEELWRTDGTAEGTERLEDIYAGETSSSPAYLTVFDNLLYFAATSGLHGRELWRTNGNPRDARLVSLRGHDQGIAAGTASSNPTEMTAANDGSRMFFAAEDRYRGRELWMVHSLSVLVGSSDKLRDLERIDIVPGVESSNPSGFEAGDLGKVYFKAFTPTSGYELFCADGNPSSSAAPIADIMKGRASSNPEYLIYFKGSVYFQADDGSHGKEPWRWIPSGSACSDGHAELLMDIRGGFASSGASFFTIMTSRHSGMDYLYFSATDGRYTSGADSVEGWGGSQIWRTDGTRKGTKRALQKTDNDLYIDKKWINMDYPRRFHVYEDALYMPASYGLHDVTVPKQGFRAQNTEALRGIDQALVISDVDTPPNSNVTVTLNVSQGLIGITSEMQVEEATQKSLHFLIAEDRGDHRRYIINVLDALGHTSEVALNGQEAYDMLIDNERGISNSAKQYAKKVFDCAIIEIDLSTSNGGLDGFQVARSYRTWENERSSTPDMDNFGKYPQYVNRKPSVLISVAPRRHVINVIEESESVGFNLHLTLPTIKYLEPNGLLNLRTDPTPNKYVDTSVSLAELEQKKERALYEKLINGLLDFLTRGSIGLNVTVVDQGSVSSVPTTILKELPGATVGQIISLEGTLFQINSALRNVYYYAHNVDEGNVSLTVTAEDLPLQCSQEAQHIFRSTSPKDRSTVISSFASNSSTLCDAAHKQSTTRTIHISVIPVNKPPSITLKDDNTMSKAITVSAYAVLDGPDLVLPAMIMTDPDASVSSFKTSYGRLKLPPVSLIMTTVMGRLSIDPSLRIKIPLLQGRGLTEKSISLLAPLDHINEALAAVKYQCRSADKCTPGMDSIQVMVSDEGFSGSGGALTDQMTLKVQIREKDGSLGIMMDNSGNDNNNNNKNVDNYESSNENDNNSGGYEGAAGKVDIETQTTEATVNMEEYILNFPRKGSPEEGTDQFSSASPGYRRLHDVIDFVDDADIDFN